jgi:hypothetical protein
MPLFERYIGIDYSGAAKPVKPVRGLRVFVADRHAGPREQQDPESTTRNWSRSRLASWLLDRLLEDQPTIVGLDHAFSYPLEAMNEGVSESWDQFLEWFEELWPTRTSTVRESLPANQETLSKHRKALRLTDRCAPTAMPLCSGWEANGPNVFYSTHAGIPWLRWLRKKSGNNVHFWPFDGLEVPWGKSVIAEVYPRVFKRRFESSATFTPDQRDAWLVCQWLRHRDERDCLGPWFRLPLDEDERRQARIEGWMLGVS